RAARRGGLLIHRRQRAAYVSRNSRVQDNERNSLGPGGHAHVLSAISRGAPWPRKIARPRKSRLARPKISSSSKLRPLGIGASRARLKRRARRLSPHAKRSTCIWATWSRKGEKKGPNST